MAQPKRKLNPTRKPAREEIASREPPPVPEDRHRHGVPANGSPPHGEEASRPKDSGRHGA